MSAEAQYTPTPEKRALGRLIGEFERSDNGQGSVLSRGDISSLRRMDTKQPSTVFWRLMAAIGNPERTANARQWARVVKCMALMAPHVHLNGERPGQVLREVGFSSSSDLRISRLLKARGEPFEDYLTSAVRFIVNKGRPVNWFSFFDFVFDDTDTEARNRLARDFYSNN